MGKEQDIKDVMREEKSRGRKPVDTAFEREARERERAILDILRRGDRSALKEALLLYFDEKEVEERMRRYDKLTSSGG